MKRLLGAFALTPLLLCTSHADAAFHLMKVTEVFPGTGVAPNAQYVELQMYSSGQNFVTSHSIQVFDSANTVLGTFTFSGSVPNGNNQSKILIATTQAQTFFGVTADLLMSPVMLRAGGKVCFDALDCVAWGNYAGPMTGVGANFAPTVGLQWGSAIHRRLDTFGMPTVLEGGDDSNISANDFVLGAPSPTNNAGVTGTFPASTCGNNTLEGLEACDDGNANNLDACRNNCTLPLCGDGLTSNGEECDDQNTIDTDDCSNTCILPICGDGVTNGADECDDGNLINDDACLNNCTLPVCGDGILSTGEACDDGNLIDGDGCESDCTFDTCGDGNLDANEACDDGNDIADDGCTSCIIDVCGDNVVNNAGAEECDDGNAIDTDTCTNLCTLPVCGDAITSTGEECDDGNDVNEDLCRNDCVLPFCGDGIIDQGEECDDANTEELDECLTGCVLPSCGDSIVNQATEECDDGNTIDDDGCTNLCKGPASCGDGIVDADEQCDDGNTTAGDGCEANCTMTAAANTCGDGVVDADEQCDDGNTTAGDGCTEICTKEPGGLGNDQNQVAVGDDGCGCRIIGTSSDEKTTGFIALALLALGLRLRRRDRTQR